MTGRAEKLLIAGLCSLAAVRVFLFSGAYPLFNNIDEQAQVDLTLKYARTGAPREPLVPHSRDAARLFVLYGSLEYLKRPRDFPGNVFPPPAWKQPFGIADAFIDAYTANWMRHHNIEAHQPPVYYILAACWYRLGGWIGLESIRQVYWLRFLNVLLVAALVWSAYAFCKEACPGRSDLRIGVPLLLSWFPQDALYSINPDALSPLLVTLSLWMLFRWFRRDDPGVLQSLLVGLLVASAFLVKFTNLAMALVFGAVVLLKLRRWHRNGPARRPFLPAAAASIATALPVVVVFVRNKILFGDWTGTQIKVAGLGWTPRSIWDYLDHPIVTAAGLWEFWDALIRSLWRGGIVWHLEVHAVPEADWFYTLSSTVLLTVSVAAMLHGFARRSQTPTGRSLATGPPRATAALYAALAVFALSVFVLMLLSVSFDYGESFSPSRKHPYFSSGRLISGAIVPFLMLYVDGARILFGRLVRGAGLPIFLGLTCVVIATSELYLMLPIFPNESNWFHVR